MSDTPADRVKRLFLAAADLRLQAEAAETLRDHFRPAFDACWSGGRGGVGHLLPERREEALRLRYYVLDGDAEARRLRIEADDCLAAAHALNGLL